MQGITGMTGVSGTVGTAPALPSTARIHRILIVALIAVGVATAFTVGVTGLLLTLHRGHERSLLRQANSAWYDWQHLPDTDKESVVAKDKE